MLGAVDERTSQLIRFLERNNKLDNTILIFTSDNGSTLWQQEYNAGWRGKKASEYEGGHRVPFLVRWPQRIARPGSQWHRTVGQTDLLKTFAEIVGANIPDNAGEDSQSFASVLLNPLANYERVPLINHGAHGRFSITDGTWKLILPHKKSKGRAELYDLSTDPGESKNVIDENKVLASKLQATITKIVCNGRSTPGKAVSNDTGYWSDLAWMTAAEYEKRHKQEN